MNCLLICALGLTLGVGHPIYDTNEVRVENDANFNLRIHFGEDEEMYAWGSYEPGTTLTMVGQRFAKNNQTGFGFGFKPQVTERLYVLGEVGYFLNDISFREPGGILIRDEAVWTRLVGVHGRNGASGNWRPHNTEYKLHNGFGGRLGIGYRIDRFAVEVRKTFRSFAEDIDACQGPDPKCKFPVAHPHKHWQERRNLNLNAWELGLVFTL